MTNHFDHSHRDKQYFIDGSIYNCPFCGRRQISYSVGPCGTFDESNTKTTYYYLVRCNYCKKISLHLSKLNLVVVYKNTQVRCWDGEFTFPPEEKKDINYAKGTPILNEKGNVKELDELFFYHTPNASFTLDERIDRVIREPLSEAYDCLHSNFLTGASACLRKSIYKFLQHEKIPENKHDVRIEVLKKKYPAIDSDLFNRLKAVHTLTSQELHENDWQDFDAHALRFLLEITKDILIAMYVAPYEKQKRNAELSKLQSKAKFVEQ